MRQAGPPVKVMITGLGTATAQGIIKAIRKAPEWRERVTFYGLDMDLINAGVRMIDHSFPIPHARDPQYGERLKRLISHWEPNILIPIIDTEFETIVKLDLESQFEDLTVTLPPAKTIYQCDDKEVVLGALAKAQVQFTPIVKPFNNVWPKVVRPKRGGRGSRGLGIAHNVAEWQVFASRLANPCTTQFIEGTEVTVDFLVSKQGKLMAYAPRERTEVKAGVATKSRVYKDDNLKPQIERIVEVLGLRYLNNLQGIRDGDGKYWWFEVNPRWGGGSIATVEAGLNLPVIMLKHIMGEPITDHELTHYRVGYCVRRLVEDFIEY